MYIGSEKQTKQNVKKISGRASTNKVILLKLNLEYTNDIIYQVLRASKTSIQFERLARIWKVFFGGKKDIL